jgi:uncharacterized protein YukE
MNDFPDNMEEFNRQWSSCAGSLSTMKEAIAETERRSAAAFVARRDEVANALRDLAQELKRRESDLSKRLDGFIKEDGRRTYELTKMLRH